MNTYRTKFFAVCPVNSARIEYALQIKTDQRLMVEELIDAVTLIDHGFHEDIADQLHREFGGVQTLIAEHHGVQIETTRPALHPWIKPSEATEAPGPGRRAAPADQRAA